MLPREKLVFSFLLKYELTSRLRNCFPEWELRYKNAVASITRIEIKMIIIILIPFFINCFGSFLSIIFFQTLLPADFNMSIRRVLLRL
jgi:hypothetical protein